MREVGLCEGIVDAVQRRAAGRAVTRVRVRIGALQRVVEPSLAQAFSLLATDTVAAGAALDVTVVPAQLTCRDCGRESDTLDGLASCQGCGGKHVIVSGGDEIVLESLEYARSATAVAHPAPPRAAGFDPVRS